MAFQKDLKLKDNFGNEITLSNCYIRVDLVRADKLTALMKVGIYGENMKRYETRDYPFKPDVSETAPNYLIQAYNHLATLEEYEDAVRV